MANPFNAFLENLNIASQTPILADKFTCGFQFSFSENNESNPGATASGLHAILNGLWLSKSYSNAYTNGKGQVGDPLYESLPKPVFNKDFYPVNINGKLVWVIRSLSPFINNLNVLDSTIAGWMSLIDTNANPFIAQGLSNGSLTQAVVDEWQSWFNRFNTVNFADSYNGYDDARSNIAGNGIAKLFVLSDQDFTKWQVSRAGAELKILVDYLAYGGIAVVAPDWLSLNNYLTTSAIAAQVREEVGASEYPNDPDAADNVASTGLFTGPLEVIVSIDNGGLIDTRVARAGYGITGTNRVAYACQPYSYVNAGVSAALAYGLTGSELINDYSSPTGRRNFVTIFMEGYGANKYPNIPIIHCGLSGTDLTIAQESSDFTYTDIFRYPGLDGLTGERLATASKTSGLTSYRLTEANYSGLNRLFATFGKNVRVIGSPKIPDFGNDLGPNLLISTPAVADVAGIMAYNKGINGLGQYWAPIGTVNGVVLNGSLTPTIKFTSEDASLLSSRRVNFFDFDEFAGPQGQYFLATELTGATSFVVNVSDRLSVLWMVRSVREEIESYGSLIVGEGRVNNSDLWTEVTDHIRNAIIDPKYGNYLQSWTVTCDSTNNTVNGPTLTVDVELTPKRITYNYTEGSGPSAVSSFRLNITIS